jgi:DNA recombination protein RmuC
MFSSEMVLAAVAGFLAGFVPGLVLWFRQKTRTTEAEAARRIAENRAEALDQDQARMREAFSALAQQALQQNSEALANRARADLQGLLEPLVTNLSNLESHVQALEQARSQAYGNLESYLQQLNSAHRELQQATTGLNQALRSSTVRGRWGEMQLKRVVELAGMTEHIDFQLQRSAEDGRPDMVVHLANGGLLPIDAKTPFDAYAAAMEESNEELRLAKWKQHARALRSRVRNLASKRYWEQFERAPEFVILFVPAEPILCAAFEHDAALLEDAVQNRVLICSPVNLLALLKAVAYGWQQQLAFQNTRRIADEGRELLDRFANFLEHLSGLGNRLGSAVESYNKAVGSLEHRVLPSARRLSELSASNKELTVPAEIDQRAAGS